MNTCVQRHEYSRSLQKDWIKTWRTSAHRWSRALDQSLDGEHRRVADQLRLNVVERRMVDLAESIREKSIKFYLFQGFQLKSHALQRSLAENDMSMNVDTHRHWKSCSEFLLATCWTRLGCFCSDDANVWTFEFSVQFCLGVSSWISVESFSSIKQLFLCFIDHFTKNVVCLHVVSGRHDLPIVRQVFDWQFDRTC